MGTGHRGAEEQTAKAVTASRTNDVQRFSPVPCRRRASETSIVRLLLSASKVPMRPTVTPKAAAMPATLPAQTGASRQASAAKEPPLKITVSEPIDTPARYLAR